MRLWHAEPRHSIHSLAFNSRPPTARRAPSFAEGSALAVAEALALGCPVIAADIPELRAEGGAAPDYIDPLDLPAWLETLLAYADPMAEGPDPRAAQLARIEAWRPRDWAAHFEAAEDLFAQIGA